ERAGFRPHRVDLPVEDGDAAGADARAGSAVDRGDRRAHPALAVAAAVDRDRVARLSRLLHRAVTRAAFAPGAAVISRKVQDRIGARPHRCLVAIAAGVVLWSMRQGWAVFKLRRGVGDTWFYAADGRAWFRMDEQRRDVSLDQIARDLQNAVIAVEDHRFYAHIGIDPIGLGRALYRDARGGGRLEGGSTLTQQLARTLFLSNKQTLGRKAQE